MLLPAQVTIETGARSYRHVIAATISTPVGSPRTSPVPRRNRTLLPGSPS
jgi:hypothetical protein